MRKEEIIKERYSSSDPTRLEWNDRIKIALKMIAALDLKAGAQILDVGCRDGEICQLIQKIVPDALFSGLELSDQAADQAREKGIDARIANVEGDPFPWGDNHFNMVFSGELIEHLYDTDHFFEEAHRVLQPGGHLILTTPNLASWHNRFIFLPLGWQPSSSEVSIRRNLGRPFIKYPTTPPGHIHLFVWRSLKEMLQLHGFRIVDKRGTVLSDAPIIKYIDRFFARCLPTMAAGFVVGARKE